MFGAIRKRLTYANVTATLALFAALGGGAYAATHLRPNSVTSRAIKNGQVKSRDIGTGQVKGRDLARGAVNSRVIKDGRVTSADIGNGAVTSSDIGAGQVVGASIANGAVGSAQLAPAEAFHLVGDPGEPAFGNGGQGDCIWSNYTGPPVGDQNEPAGFYKDPYGVVHLTGTVMSSDGVANGCSTGNDRFEDNTVFELPSADQPPRVVAFAVAQGGTTNVVVVVGTQPVTTAQGTLQPGAVVVNGGTGPFTGGIGLDGVSFRAAGSNTGIP